MCRMDRDLPFFPQVTSGLPALISVPSTFSTQLYQRITQIMAETKVSTISKLLELPNELLHEIAFRLATTELRIFSQVNHRLHDFVVDYLARYNMSICRLPNSILCNILAQLDETVDCCRLTQISQKLYSTVMTFIISHNIQNVESSMLNYAAIGNLGHTARKMNRLGGNVNTMCGGLLRFRPDDDPASNKPFTPLMNAAAYEHKDMIRLLLGAGAGAGQVAGGIKHAVLVAMICKCQSSISILAHKLSPDDMREVLSSTRGVDFLTSYRWLLEHGRDEFVSQVGSVALYDVLSEAACEGDFVKRELNEDDYQCASVLLEYGADPDFCMLLHTDPAMRHVTTRHFASRHSDPRIRNLLLTAKLMARKPDRTDLSIEQSKLLTKEDGDEEEEEEPEPEVPTPQHPSHDFWARKPSSIMLARR